MSDDGGLAFPNTHYNCGCEACSGVHSTGMSLRDYIATKAMQAIITAAMSHDTTGQHVIAGRAREAGKSQEQYYAAWSYRMADAAIAEKRKTE